MAKIKGESQAASDLNNQRQKFRKIVKAIIKKNPKYQGVNTDLAVDLIMQRIQENQQEKLNHEALDEGKSEQNTFTTEMSRTEQKCRDLKANLAKCKALIEKEIQSSRLRSSVQYSYVPRLQRVSGMSTKKSDHNESSQSLANKEDNLHLQCQRREPQLLASVKEDKAVNHGPRRGQCSTPQFALHPREVRNAAVDLESEETQSSDETKGLKEEEPESRHRKNQAALEENPALEEEEAVQTLCRKKKANPKAAKEREETVPEEVRRKILKRPEGRKVKVTTGNQRQKKEKRRKSRTERGRGQKRTYPVRQHPGAQADWEKDICQLKKIRKSSAKKQVDLDGRTEP